MFYLKKINLTNFRCFSKAKFEFTNKINIIYGMNAIGKTSIVESILVLGCCKSHRTSNDFDLINKNEDFYLIESEIYKNNHIPDDLKMICNRNGKKISLNNKNYKNLSEYLGLFKVVIFCPEDIVLVTGTPNDKRRFLDLSISQMDKNYLNNLIIYKKILKQRNECLKTLDLSKESNEILLETYTNELIKYGKEIIKTRISFINELNSNLNNKVEVISSEKETAFIKYLPNVEVENYEIKFKSSIQLDKYNKKTNVGPHKDSFEIMINDEESSNFASQGQQKTLTLAIKLALADVIKQKDDNVVIILDDVFGELDKYRQNNLLKLLNKNSQIFITTTDIDNLSDSVLIDSNIINIEKDGN